jgi:ankyrin repeat protein
MVRLLIGSKRCEPSGLDINGRNAISWADERYLYTLHHYLLKHDRAGAEIEDEDGWAPQAWALRPPGYTDSIFILTSSGLVDINHRDRDGRSPFSFAAGYGYLEVVKVLNRMKGFEVDSRDGSGRTSFSYAAGSGNHDIVQFLTETEGVDLNSKDNAGRTPLYWAASAGHLPVVQILTHTQGVDVECPDQYGRPPLWYATHHATQDIAAALGLRI